jgi:hypothetical protein
MLNQPGKCLMFLVLVTFSGCLSGGNKIIGDDNRDSYSGYEGTENELINIEETQEAFPNPMKGFRPTVYTDRTTFSYHEYGRVYKQYVRYSDLESSSEDTVQKILDWSNRAWTGIEQKNIKVIPRVVLTYPISNKLDSPANDFWPNDIYQPSSVSRWTTKELYNRLENFVRKLGEAWDNDPRVAAIELGLWGYWGEHHLLSNGKIPSSVQKILGDAFSNAFKNKKVMVRYPETFSGYRFGFYWDSFALSDDSESGNGIIRRNAWKNQMIGGEVAYDWGNRSQLGKSPTDTVSSNKSSDFLIGWIRRTHASSLGWVSDYNSSSPNIKENAARIQKSLGYRYVIRSVIYRKIVNSGQNIELSFKVSNSGSAPFYYKWPIEISFLDHDRVPIAKKIISDIDITSWMPDETYTVNANFSLPQELGKGTYIVAISIVDPSGNRPSLRFANKNYYNGGRTPIGIIGVNQEPAFNDFGTFDLLKDDNTLGYELQ